MNYSFETLLKRGNREVAVEIHFDYFLPPHFNTWQDKEHGSIHLVFIKNCFTGELVKVKELAIEEQIRVRRACWNYLERRALLLSPNVVDLFS